MSPWGGDSKFWGLGGTGPHGGGQPLDGVGSPPIPPYWTTLIYIEIFRQVLVETKNFMRVDDGPNEK